MQERNEQLAERLRIAERARDLLVDLERRLKVEDSPEPERLLAQLDQLARSLPEADRIRWFVESAAGSARERDARKAGTGVSRSRSAIEGEISTLRGTLERGIT
jgi:hypothetical protein